jgi:arsenate reductase (thioredoxin)
VKVQGRILFVCYGNACRSIIAEALTNHHFGDSIEVASAGIAPLGHIPENTRLALEEVQVSWKGLRSKSIDGVALDRFDRIINLMDMPIQPFIPKRFHDKIIDSYVQDPFGRSLTSYRHTREAIEKLVLNSLSGWLEAS